jgi:hypothetical protein
MGNAIYTYITEETARNARDRVEKELGVLTNGHAFEAIALVKEFEELEKIMAKFEEKAEANGDF